MDDCYSSDHIAEDHKHTDISYDSDEPQQKYRLGMASKTLLGTSYTQNTPENSHVS